MASRPGDVCRTSAEDRVNIIAFNGSPRRGGNTQTLLEEAIRGAKDRGCLFYTSDAADE